MSSLPRPTALLRLLLALTGLGLAAAAWQWLDIKLIAYLSGLAAPFCMLCAGAVWALRDKAEDRLLPDTDDRAAIARAQKVVAGLQQRFLPRAAWTAVAAVLAGGPATSHQLVGTVWQWSVFCAGLAVSEAAYSYLLASSWDRQLRAERAARADAALRDRERLELLRAAFPDRDAQAEIQPWARSDSTLVPTPSTH